MGRTVTKMKSGPGAKAWDIECVGNHNFIGGRGMFLLHNTNQPEYKRLQNNEFMQALKDRTVKIDVPYITKWDQEVSVLNHQYRNMRHHIAPHTKEIGAFWAILTRLEDDKHGKLTLVQKAELYNGKLLPNYTDDQVKELRDSAESEGMETGISCRFVQDCISDCLSENPEYINPFMVLNAIKERLANSALIHNKELIARCLTCVELAIKKLENVLKNEVQKAMVGDTEAIIRLCALYIENVMAFIKKGTIKNPFTGKLEKHNERLMREIERKIDVPDHGAGDFRREIAAFIGDLATQNKKFAWDSNQELKEALELKLFDDIKDTIKLSTMSAEGASVFDKEQQEKIDALKARMIKWYGYNDKSATDVLNYVGSIWARGEATEEN